MLSPDTPFNAKSDNFLDLHKIHNLVVSSLQDEEEYNVPISVGTIQLFNREHSDVTQEDMNRVIAIRKLLGATLIKCAYYSSTL